MNKEIRSYLEKHTETKTDQEYELCERIKAYSIYFEVQGNGTLNGYERKRGEKVKEPKLRIGSTWKDVSDYKLFPHEPAAADVHQRLTEDCYLLSALSSIAYHKPETIKDAMRDNGDGTVTVRFYDDSVTRSFGQDTSLENLSKAYAQADEIEQKQIKKELLTKLFSSFSSGAQEGFIKKYLASKPKKATDNKSAEPQNKKVDLAAAMDDDDFLDDESIKKSLEQNAEKDIKNDIKKEPEEEAEYNVSIEGVQKLLKSNSRDWYEEVCETMLAKDSPFATELNDQLKQLLESKDGNNAEQMETIMSHFLDKLNQSEMMSALRDFVHKTKNEQMEKLPIYVTVSKKIDTFYGGMERDAANSLWVQMIEKAYVLKYGKNATYGGINLGKSSVFLNRFARENYEDRKISNKPVTANGISIEVGGVQIPAKVMDKVIIQSTKKSPEAMPTLEDLVDELKKNQEYKNLTEEQTKLVTDELEKHYYFQHRIFSGRYTVDGLNEFQQLSERTGRGETVTVGADVKNERRKKCIVDSGIRVGHAYAVMNCFTKGDHRFVTLRDPYALFKREYEKDTDKKGNVSYKKVDAGKISLSANDTNGIFYMEFNDFLSTFNMYSGIIKVGK